MGSSDCNRSGLNSLQKRTFNWANSHPEKLIFADIEILFASHFALARFALRFALLPHLFAHCVYMAFCIGIRIGICIALLVALLFALLFVWPVAKMGTGRKGLKCYGRL